jgi:hypothetical protein
MVRMAYRNAMRRSAITMMVVRGRGATIVYRDSINPDAVRQPPGQPEIECDVERCADRGEFEGAGSSDRLLRRAARRDAGGRRIRGHVG